MISSKRLIQLLQYDDKELDKAVDAMNEQELKDLVKLVIKSAHNKDIYSV